MTCEGVKLHDGINSSMANGTEDGACKNVSGEIKAFDAVIRRTQEPPLIESNFWLAVVYMSIMSLALLTGTAGNCVILMVSACYKSVRRTGYQFIVNLAVADLCVTAIADPMCVIAILKGEAWFNDKPWLCTTVAAMCITACFCAFFNLLIASLNRYICICHYSLYYRIFSKRNCVFLCVGAWLAAFIAQFPNFVGWGAHGYDKKSHQCIWDRTASYSYTLVVSVGLIGTPLGIMGLSYFLTFRKIYSTKVNLYKMDENDPFRVKKIWMETAKSSKMLFVIFVLFVMLWVPYAVVIGVDVQDKMPVALHLLVTMFAHLHSSANCIVYMIANRKFRQAFLRLVSCGGRCWWCRLGAASKRRRRAKMTISDNSSSRISGSACNSNCKVEAGLGAVVGVATTGKISTIGGGGGRGGGGGEGREQLSFSYSDGSTNTTSDAVFGSAGSGSCCNGGSDGGGGGCGGGTYKGYI